MLELGDNAGVLIAPALIGALAATIGLSLSLGSIVVALLTAASAASARRPRSASPPTGRANRPVALTVTRYCIRMGTEVGRRRR